MSLASRFLMASKAFVAALRGYSDPTQDEVDASLRLQEYGLFHSYYENSTFDKALEGLWTRYKQDQRLVPYLRSLYNPTAKLVDFYVGAVYPGSVSADGDDLPDGVRSAVPLAKDTNPKLKDAIGQMLRWSNWQVNKDLYVQYGAVTGDVAIEIADEWPRSKVLMVPMWPGHIVAVDRNREGNVEFYAVEFQSFNRDRLESGETTLESFVFRKEVDADEIRTFRDGKLYDYEKERFSDSGIQPNIYGFVPLVWVNHRVRGTDHGAPAIAGSLPKLEAINHLLSMIIKDTEIISRAPHVLSTDSTITPALSPEAQVILDSAEINLTLLRANIGTGVHKIESNMDLEAVLKAIDTITSYVERDHPEITFYEKLREMSQVTGPAARRLVGDTQSNATRAAASYDDGLIRALKMGISVATIRQARGEWERNDDAQQKFAPFSPESFGLGELEFDIMPRPLIEETQDEKWDAEIKRAQVVTDWQGAGLPPVFAMSQAGFTADDLTKFFTENAQFIRDQQLTAAADIPVGQIGPGNGQPPAQ